MQDLEFNMNYNYEKIEIITIKKLFFFFSKLELFTKGTFNNFIKKKELSTIL